MKLLLSSLLLLVAMHAPAVESGKIADVPRPLSVFDDKSGKDPFSPKRKTAAVPQEKEKPVYRLTLNAITQENGQSSALISGAVLKEGEVSFLKNGDTSIKIVCKEIRQNSVILQVASNAAPIELNFGHALKVDEKGSPSVLQK